MKSVVFLATQNHRLHTDLHCYSPLTFNCATQADLHFSLASLRCDNCLPDAAHPVAFAAPVIRSWWGPPILPPQPAPIPALPPLLSMHSQPLPCAAAGNSSSDTSSSTALQCTTAAGHATSSSDNTGSKNTTSSSRVGDVDSAKGVWTRGSRGLGMLTQRGVLTQRATSPQQSTAVSAHAVVCLNVPGKCAFAVVCLLCRSMQCHAFDRQW